MRCSVAVLVALVGCAPSARRARAPSAGERTLTVATFNLHGDDALDEDTVGVVGRLDADVLCLQEVTPRWERALVERWGERYPHRALDVAGGSRGMAVLSRHPIERRESVQPEGARHRGQRVTIRAPAGVVHVLNVHLRPVLSGRGDPLSSLAAAGDDHVRELSALLPGGGARPLVVCGDLNEGPDGDAVRLLADAGLTSALPLFHPGQETWRAPSPGAQLGATFDHVLFDDHFDALDARVVAGGSSDHLPVVAVLALTDPSTPPPRAGAPSLARPLPPR